MFLRLRGASGQILRTTTPSSGTAATSIDGTQAGTPTTDGDEAAHGYIGRLDGSGPRLLLHCAASNGSDKVTAQFKGWPDPHGFDLAIEIHAARSKLVQQIAARITQNAAGWNIAATNPEPLETMGFIGVAAASLRP